MENQNFNQPPVKKKTSIGKVILYVVLGFVALGILGAIFGDDKSQTTTSTANNNESTEQANEQSAIGIGSVLKTQYFDITANSMAVSEIVDTGNEYTSLKKEQGNKFIIISATFKNTDSESRLALDGDLLINYNGKDYKYDAAEAIMEEGFGSFEQLNPLVTKTTKIVYKVPAELTGKVHWNPGRSADQVIFLGEVK